MSPQTFIAISWFVDISGSTRYCCILSGLLAGKKIAIYFGHNLNRKISNLEKDVWRLINFSINGGLGWSTHSCDILSISISFLFIFASFLLPFSNCRASPIAVEYHFFLNFRPSTTMF